MQVVVEVRCLLGDRVRTDKFWFESLRVARASAKVGDLDLVADPERRVVVDEVVILFLLFGLRDVRVLE